MLYIMPGAHCEGQNANSIGICYAGGLAADGKTPKDTRTVAQKAALLKLIRDLKLKYPGATVHGHREFANKACPCFDAKSEYK
jgi:N-acetylmuramoyl-L-alanine amidase